MTHVNTDSNDLYIPNTYFNDIFYDFRTSIRYDLLNNIIAIQGYSGVTKRFDKNLKAPVGCFDIMDSCSAHRNSLG